MRIEQVRFDNINSLGGHFELDFTHPSLTDTGIFVMTGPTGAGKTTLLDAITYALYGQTNRQGRLTGASNEIMTHGTSFCRAELIVEKDGARYLFTTEQRRRRTRVAGNDPFSTAERSVSRLEADGSVTLISKAKSAVDKFAAGLMKYDNFCRCMMLAQGDFARFLKAAADERSETLATITGTEIYQRIGEKVQARVAALRSAIASVALLPVLDAAAREQAEQRRREQDERCKTIQAALEQLNRELTWHAELSKATTTRQSCAELQQKAAAALQQFDTAGYPARIKDAEAALDIRPQEVARHATAQALADAEQKYKAEQVWLREHPDTELKAVAAQAATELAEQQPKLKRQLAFLAEQVQPQEDAIAKATVKATEATRSAAAREKEAESAAATAQAEALAAQEATRALEQAEAALAPLAADTVLSDELPAIRQRLADWQKCPQTEEELPGSAEIAERVDAEAAERAAILSGRRREELLLRHDRLEALARLSTRKDESAASAQKLAFAKAEADAELAALPSVEEADRACNAAHERAQLAFNIQSMSSKLDELYREFCAGKLALCPCCGSPRPHERPVQSADILKEARLAEKAARTELAARQKARDAAREKRAAAKAACKAAEQAFARICAEHVEALNELGWQELPTDLAEQADQLHRNIQRLAELDTIAAGLQALSKQDACRRALHEALRPCTPAQPARLAEACALVRQLGNRQKAFAKAAEQKERRSRELALAHERRDLAAKNAESAAQRLEDAKAAEASARQALAEKQAALSALWQGGPARKAEETLRSTLTALQEACHSSREKLQQLTLMRESHAARAKAAGEQLPALRDQLEKDELSFRAALAEHGFANEDTYRAALQHTDALKPLRQQLSTLQQALDKAEGASKQAAEQEEKLRQQALSSESAEALTERQTVLSKELEAQSEHLNTLHAELLRDDAAHRDNAEKEAQIADTRRELAQWQRLYEILGGTRDGFKKYAQRITFNLLLRQANERLRMLTDRYTLAQDEKLELGLRVIDRYQDDEKGRSCSNLSGGESFIVSLALALGLAQMAGETRIDTLFLDEGFGTLDEDALEQVLSCLQGLRSGGKLIGIISHVDALRERIPAHIELQPRGVTGRSTILPHEAVVAQPA